MRRCGSSVRAGHGVCSACQLLDQQAHGEVDAQRADLIIAQVVDDRVRDPHGAAGGLDSGELARVGAGEVRLDRCLSGIYQQVFQLLFAGGIADGADCGVDDLLEPLAVGTAPVHLAAALAAGERLVGAPGNGA